MTEDSADVTWVHADDVYEDDRLRGSAHRSRRWLEGSLDDPAGDSWQELLAEYDAQAPAWKEWADTQETYLDALKAGLARTGGRGRTLEVGAGSGQASVHLAQHCEDLLVTDISWEMVSRGPRDLAMLVADVRHLPLRDDSVDLIVGLNAVPSLPEFDRVLRNGGKLLWATSFGRHTPLYVAPEVLLARLGPGWHALAGRVGPGEWAVYTKEPWWKSS